MTSEQLKDTLRQLHTELANAPEPDPELQALLATLERDIHGVLEKNADTTPAPASPGVADSIESIAARFEAEHPNLAPALRQVGEALSRMGI